MAVLFSPFDSENNIIEESIGDAQVMHIIQYSAAILRGILVFLTHMSPVSFVMQTGRQASKCVVRAYGIGHERLHADMPMDAEHLRDLLHVRKSLMAPFQYANWWEFVQVIALMVIFIVAIFLLRYAVRYLQREREHVDGGVVIMAGKKEDDDVISEIDREISDIIDEEVGEGETVKSGKIEEETAHPPSRQVDKKPAPAKKSAEETASQERPKPDRKEAEEQPSPKDRGELSGLERDGIIIKKG